MKRISMIEVVAKETIDELIQIVDIENMLTIKEISELEYGKELKKYYICGKKCMIKEPSGSFLLSIQIQKNYFLILLAM